MEPVPLQDVERVKAAGKFTVLQGPELRTIFLGMDQKHDELQFSSVKGKNPFKDRRVRQAFYQAIDIDAIKSRVMRNAATPTALMVGSGVRGFQPDLNKRLPCLGSYSNSRVDELTQKVQSETDQKKRNDYIREAFRLHQDDIGHIPLHQQALAWGFNNKVSLSQLPGNRMFFKSITAK